MNFITRFFLSSFLFLFFLFFSFFAFPFPSFRIIPVTKAKHDRYRHRRWIKRTNFEVTKTRIATVPTLRRNRPLVRHTLCSLHAENILGWRCIRATGAIQPDRRAGPGCTSLLNIIASRGPRTKNKPAPFNPTATPLTGLFLRSFLSSAFTRSASLPVSTMQLQPMPRTTIVRARFVFKATLPAFGWRRCGERQRTGQGSDDDNYTDSHEAFLPHSTSNENS